MSRRVVITGVGVISSLGIGKEQYFNKMLAGEVGIDRITNFDPSQFACRIGSEAPQFKINDYVPKSHRKATKLMSRDIMLAVVASDCAVRDAGLKTKGTCPDESSDLDPIRSGVNIGAGLICCDLEELGAAAEHAVENGKFSLKKWGKEGMEALTPLWLLKYLPNMLSCHISIIHDLQGPSNAITCAEASGLLAIGEAYRTIENGKADVMIAGGAECKINPLSLVRQSLLKRTSTRYNDKPKQACRPFDSEADGTVLGEGGGIVILEELEHAQARNAAIYAEITGFGASNCFCDHFVDPAKGDTGIGIAMRKALAEAELSADRIDLLTPHGVSVPASDAVEAAAIESVFGKHGANMPIVTSKDRVGNCGAGAGGIDLVTAVLAMHEGKLPANVNSTQPAANIKLNAYRPNVIEAAVDHVMVSSTTYGGQTAAIVLSKITSKK